MSRRAFEAESLALRRIRSHRHRRAAWRHAIRVRRARVRLCGLGFLAVCAVTFAAFGEVSLLALVFGAVALAAPDLVTRVTH